MPFEALKECKQTQEENMDNPQQSISLIRRYFEELFNKGNLDICDELLAQNLKITDPARTSINSGSDAYKKLQRMYQEAFPNRKVKIDDILAANDKVVVRWTLQATHKGNLDDISATNKPVKITGISIYRLANGKISEIWQNWDRLSLLEQIGEIQPAHALH